MIHNFKSLVLIATSTDQYDSGIPMKSNKLWTWVTIVLKREDTRSEVHWYRDVSTNILGLDGATEGNKKEAQESKTIELVREIS